MEEGPQKLEVFLHLGDLQQVRVEIIILFLQEVIEM